ncbi:5771_t:CDS:2 [Entrophospora sp. SA101]|nr:5771_t:CDS:2 [Entrophospora sp. SA101]
MSEKDFTDEEQSAAASVLISQVCRCAYGSLLAKSRYMIDSLEPGSKAILEPF